MDTSILLLIFLTIVMILAWAGKYRSSIVLYLIFLAIAMAVFVHHITEQLTLNF